MYRPSFADSKSKSKHVKELPKQLRKIRTEKDLLSPEKPPSRKSVIGRSSSNKQLHHVQTYHYKSPEVFRPSPTSKAQTPKWNLHYRKPYAKQPHKGRTQMQLKRIEKEILVEKPKIMKQKTESYTHLQLKLKSLEEKLDLLKTSMSKNEIRSHTKSKSKEKKSQSQASRGISLQEQKNDSMIIQSQALHNYVTQVKPNQQSKKRNFQLDNLSGKLKVPYYVGHLTKHISGQKQDCPVYEHILQSVTTINFMKRIQKPMEHQLQKKKLNLKMHSRNHGRKTVIFDLDETLIHCNQVEAKYDVKLPIVFPNGEKISAGINIRPYAREVLENLSKLFQVVVFTASHSCYANTVIDYLDPSRKVVSHRLFREHCFETESGMYIKDLRILKNRSLSNIVLVDNAAYSYYFQLDNGIPVVPFYNNKKDCELLSLEHFLMQDILPAEDVREVLRSKFKLSRYGEFNNPVKMIDALYL